MRNLLFIFLSLFIFSCATTKKVADEDNFNSFVGQNEAFVKAKLGMPVRVNKTDNGGKVLIYDFYSRGTFLTPNKSKLNNRGGIILSSDKYRVTNTPAYTIYQINVSHLNVYIDKQGKCARFEQTLPREQQDLYHERFKHFYPAGSQYKSAGH